MENPAFISFIFDVLVGVVNIFLVDFIKISIKSIKTTILVLKYLSLGEK